MCTGTYINFSSFLVLFSSFLALYLCGWPMVSLLDFVGVKRSKVSAFSIVFSSVIVVLILIL